MALVIVGSSALGERGWSSRRERPSRGGEGRATKQGKRPLAERSQKEPRIPSKLEAALGVHPTTAAGQPGTRRRRKGEASCRLRSCLLIPTRESLREGVPEPCST